MHGNYSMYKATLRERQGLQAEDFTNCYHCGEPLDDVRFTVETYDSPYDEQACVVVFCSGECMDEELFYKDDFRYFECIVCGRVICHQHPNNGWHVQSREIQYGEEICLQCYEEDKLVNGLSLLDFADGIPGLFLDQHDYVAKGWAEVPDYADYYICDKQTKEQFVKKATDLIEQDQKVMVAYERMAYGGSEGYATLLTRA